jgi:hypothetical protein
MIVIAAFLIFAFTIGISLYYVPGKLGLKIHLALAMFYMASALFFSFDTHKGWPAPDGVTPDKMVIVGVVIFEKTTKSDGMIFVTGIPCSSFDDIARCFEEEHNASLWTKLSPYKIFGYEPDNVNTPRIFEFPYTDKNRKMFGEAKQNIADGGVSIYHKGQNEKEGKGKGKGGDGQGNDPNAIGEDGGAHDGDVSPNAQSASESEIYVDNLSLRDVLKKE